MNFLRRLWRYPLGSIVKRAKGPFVVKTKEGWISQQRHIWQNSRAEELKEGDRVFFIDGNPENTDPTNLAKIQFSRTRYKFRDASGPIYIPENVPYEVGQPTR